MGLLAWFPLDESRGARTVDFVTGAAASLTGGPRRVSGKVAGAMELDGRDDFVEVAAGDAAPYDIGTGGLSFDAWVRLAPAAAGWNARVIVEKRQADPLRGYSFFLYKGRPGVQLADASGHSNYVASAAVPADGRWHFVAATVERRQGGRSVGRFYIDGVAVGRPFDPSNRPGSLANSAPLRLGSESVTVGPRRVFAGALDEVEVFSRSLSPGEVAALFRAGSSGKCKAAAITLQLECDGGAGPSTEVEVTGILSAKAAIAWVKDNCKSSVTVHW